MLIDNFGKAITALLFVVGMYTFHSTISYANDLEFITMNSSCRDDVENANSYGLAVKKWVKLDKKKCVHKHKCKDTMKQQMARGDYNCFAFFKTIARVTNDPENAILAQGWVDSVRPQQKKESEGITFVHCTPHKNDPNLIENGGTYKLCDYAK